MKYLLQQVRFVLRTSTSQFVLLFATLNFVKKLVYTRAAALYSMIFFLIQTITSTIWGVVVAVVDS